MSTGTEASQARSPSATGARLFAFVPVRLGADSPFGRGGDRHCRRLRALGNLQIALGLTISPPPDIVPAATRDSFSCCRPVDGVPGWDLGTAPSGWQLRPREETAKAAANSYLPGSGACPPEKAAVGSVISPVWSTYCHEHLEGSSSLPVTQSVETALCLGGLQNQTALGSGRRKLVIFGRVEFSRPTPDCELGK